MLLKKAKYNPTLTLPEREGIRPSLISSLSGRVRVGLKYSKKKTLQFTIPCLKTLNYSIWVRITGII
jgi:hypothetical protein